MVMPRGKNHRSLITRPDLHPCCTNLPSLPYSPFPPSLPINIGYLSVLA